MSQSLLKFAGCFTFVQAVIQFILTGLGLMQYFCFVDVLQHFPTLIYIRILYFANPNCGSTIQLGYAVSQLPDHTMVLINREPETTFRMFLVNAVYFPISIIWIIASSILIQGARRQESNGLSRWPWILVTLIMLLADIVTTVWFLTDTFTTRTLSELVSSVGGVLSGAAGTNPSTVLAAWLVAGAYGRFLLILLVNLGLIVCVLTSQRVQKDTYSDTESAIGRSAQNETPIIPRVSILRRFPNILNYNAGKLSTPRRDSSFKNATRNFFTKKLKRAPPYQPTDKTPTVNFPENLLSLPQRLETLIAEQQRRLETATVDTSGRRNSNGSAASGEDVTTTDPTAVSGHVDNKGRRNTAAELQGQLPWSYIPPSSHRMRDQLPADEDLPPVPVPDYTLHPKYRKASVHRAGSNSSPMFHKKEERNQQASASQGRQLMQADVLY